jgi:Alpha amylase, catalytic domain
MTATMCPTITVSIRATARPEILSNSPTVRSNAAYVFSPISWSITRRTNTRGSSRHARTPIRNSAIGTFGQRRSHRAPITAWYFPGVQKSTWSYDQQAKAWYFHRFYDFQPDLNTSYPEVQAEILKIMGFWIRLGVSGFRMDAVPFVIAIKGAKVGKPGEQYDMLRLSGSSCSGDRGTASCLREANVLAETNMENFGADGDRMHMMFNFQVNQNLLYALASADARPLIKAMKATKPRPATAQWGPFLRNHDELDLGHPQTRLSKPAVGRMERARSRRACSMALYSAHLQGERGADRFTLDVDASFGPTRIARPPTVMRRPAKPQWRPSQKLARK